MIELIKKGLNDIARELAMLTHRYIRPAGGVKDLVVLAIPSRLFICPLEHLHLANSPVKKSGIGPLTTLQ